MRAPNGWPSTPCCPFPRPPPAVACVYLSGACDNAVAGITDRRIATSAGILAGQKPPDQPSGYLARGNCSWWLCVEVTERYSRPQLLVGNLAKSTQPRWHSRRGGNVSHYKSNVRDQVFNLFEVLGLDKALGEGEY